MVRWETSTAASYRTKEEALFNQVMCLCVDKGIDMNGPFASGHITILNNVCLNKL